MDPDVTANGTHYIAVSRSHVNTLNDTLLFCDIANQRQSGNMIATFVGLVVDSVFRISNIYNVQSAYVSLRVFGRSDRVLMIDHIIQFRCLVTL